MRVRMPSVERMTGVSMGTTWRLTYRRTAEVAAHTVRELVESVFDTVIAQMSTWKPGSTIGRFNASAPGTWHPLPSAFTDVLRTALRWAALSEGAFDPTVGSALRIWNFGANAQAENFGQIPADSEIAAARQRVDWRRLELRAAGSGAAPELLQPGGASLDFSGIAKGYAVDRAVRALREASLEHVLLELGGELAARGLGSGGMPWSVGIDPLDGGPPLPVPLRDRSIATSGDAFHHFDRGGRRFAHTIDPRTACPVAHGLASVSVIHANGVDADALATLLTVLGPEAGAAFARRHRIAALLIERRPCGSLRSHASPAFVALL